MEKTVKVSVIMLAYNIENYIETVSYTHLRAHET